MSSTKVRRGNPQEETEVCSATGRQAVRSAPVNHLKPTWVERAGQDYCQEQKAGKLSKFTTIMMLLIKVKTKRKKRNR